jgi:hypothetical protein
MINKYGENIATVLKNKIEIISEQETTSEVIAALQKLNDINTYIDSLVQKSGLE